MTRCYAGTKAELTTRILRQFHLSHPCSAPLLVVAHLHAHALRVLRTAHALADCVPIESLSNPFALLVRFIAALTPHELVPVVKTPRRWDHITAAQRRVAEELAHTAAGGLRESTMTVSKWIPILHVIADEEMGKQS